MLSIENIISTGYFQDEGFDRPRWSDNSNYTTLRTFGTKMSTSGDMTTSTTSSESNTENMTVNEIMWHDASTGESSVLVSHLQLIPDGMKQPLAIDDYVLSPDKSKILIFTKAQKVWRTKTRGSYWILELKNENSNCLRQLGGNGDANCDQPHNTKLMFATFSPNSLKVAYVRDNNIYVEDITTHNITQITNDGSQFIINGTFDWVYEEELKLTNGFRWSPDNNFISYWQIDQSEVGIVNLVNNTDNLYPRVIPIPYPKTGTTNPSAKVGVVSANGGETIWMNVPGDSRDNYIVDLDYISNTGEIVIQQMNRLQNQLTVMLADPVSGYTLPFHTDHDDAWIDAHQNVRWIENGTKFVAISEKGGWKQIYLVNKDVNLESILLTPEPYDVDSIVGCDEINGIIYYIASPDDPLRRYLYSVKLDGSCCNTRITPDDIKYKGSNSYSVSKDGKFAVHTFSAFHISTVTSIISLPSHSTTVVLASNLQLQTRFEEVNDKLPVEFFKVPLDNDVVLDAYCILPPNCDVNSTKKYPVIFHVYGEPAAQIVKDAWGGRLSLWHRMLAEQGAVIICVDNRGTPAPKGRTWRKCIYEKVGLLASEDQANATKYILKDRKYLDPTRVGLWGWSGGGSMTLNGMFRYSDLYTCGISVAPVPDMRLYDTIYQERYMGLPSVNKVGYFDGSPVNFVHLMKQTQNLMLIHGTGDDNCHYQGTEKLINELVRLALPFSMMAYPNRSHSISEGFNTHRHLFDTMTRFFKSSGMLD